MKFHQRRHSFYRAVDLHARTMHVGVIDAEGRTRKHVSGCRLAAPGRRPCGIIPDTPVALGRNRRSVMVMCRVGAGLGPAQQ